MVSLANKQDLMDAIDDEDYLKQKLVIDELKIEYKIVSFFIFILNDCFTNWFFVCYLDILYDKIKNK